MSTPELAIALMACLSPLTGTRSEGSAVVRSTGASGTLPAGAYAFPVLRGQVDFTKPFRANTTADTTVTQAGTTVAITSVLGGDGINLDGATQLVWFPANDGVEPISLVAPAAMTGGLPEQSIFGVKSVVWFEEPAAGQVADDLLRAAIRATPAIVLSWSGRPSGTTLRGPKQLQRTDRWQALVITSRQDAHHTRGLQSLTLVDLVEAELADRASVDGLVVSAPPIKMLSVQRVAVNPGVYAFAVSFETHITTVTTDDTKRAVYANWERTRFDFRTQTDEGVPTLDVVEGATYPQP